MAITKQRTDVLWTGSAQTDSIAAGGNETSLEFNLGDTCVAARITLKGDNASGTPAADDQIDFYLLETTGDPDGTEPGTDEFATSGHGLFLGRLDTNVEDPAIKTVQLPIPQKGAKIYATGTDSGSTNAITVSATIEEQLAA